MCQELTIVHQLLSGLADDLDPRLVSMDLGVEGLVLLDQVLHPDQVATPVGGRRQGLLLPDPGLLVIDIAQELVQGVGGLQLLLAGQEGGLQEDTSWGSTLRFTLNKHKHASKECVIICFHRGNKRHVLFGTVKVYLYPPPPPPIFFF